MIKLIDVHQANVIGLGAKKFSNGLVDHLSNIKAIKIKKIYLNKQLSIRHGDAGSNINYVNYFFGGFSRLFEIFFWRLYREQENELLVLGDLPLNTAVKQYVFCQQSLLFKHFPIYSFNFFKFSLFRLIFKLFLKKTDVVLVQSEEMATNIRQIINYDIDVHVIDVRSDFFGWPRFLRTKKQNLNENSENFELIYPSAFYPHKNHYLLGLIKLAKTTKIILTIDKKDLTSNKNLIKCIGRVTREEIYELYKKVDALLFLSSNESLGMPIIEAVKCNLPVICPRAEYTKELGSDNCFFFDIDDPSSLEQAIYLAQKKISSGWWPRWEFNKIFNSPNCITIEEAILKK